MGHLPEASARVRHRLAHGTAAQFLQGPLASGVSCIWAALVHSAPASRLSWTDPLDQLALQGQEDRQLRPSCIQRNPQ